MNIEAISSTFYIVNTSISYKFTSSLAFRTAGAEIVAKESRFSTSKYNDKQFLGVQHFDIRCKAAVSKSII